MPEQRRDEAIERLLPGVLSARTATEAGQDCLDAETAAAWTDGALPVADAMRLEQHVSDCGRCQALVASLVSTTPVPVPAEAAPIWRRWKLPWLVPLATAATAVALWVAAPDQAPVSPAAELEKRIAALPEPAPAPPSPTSPSTPRASASNSRASATPDEVSPSAPVAAPPSFAREQPPAVAQEEVTQQTDAAPAESARRLEEADSLAKAQTAAKAEAPAAETQKTRDTAAREASNAATPAPQPALPAGAAVGALSARQAFTATIVGSPAHSTRWRITGRRVERSTNGGTQWDPIALQSPGDLTAGSAPSASVCWIVGRLGAVFVTTDATMFVRLTFPEAVDLVSVTATDAQNATVRSADGRSWRTTDGGRSWISGGQP